MTASNGRGRPNVAIRLLRALKRHRARLSRGQALVEFAVILPLMMPGLASLGRWLSGMRRRQARLSRGQSLVELALVMPIMILLFAAALDLGRVFYSQITITNAAQQAALEAATDAGSGSISYHAGQPCDATTNRVVCRAITESGGSFVTVAPADISLTCSASSCPPTTPALGDTVSVKVIGHFQLLTPLMSVFFGGQDLTLSSTAIAQMVVAPVAPPPTPTPTPTPTATATAAATTTATTTATPTPTATATPTCLAPAGGPITVTPTSGQAANYRGNNATSFKFSSANVTNMTAGCNPVWSWSFGDGSGTSSEPEPTYSYAHNQDKKLETVTLVASTYDGLTTRTTIFTLTIQL